MESELIPDLNKQAYEVIFIRKSKNISRALLILNNTKVSQSTTQKHLGLMLDKSLSFQEYLTAMVTKVSKTIALLRKLQHILPRQALIIIYKALIHPYLVTETFFTTKRLMHNSIKKQSLSNIMLVYQ